MQEEERKQEAKHRFSMGKEDYNTIEVLGNVMIIDEIKDGMRHVGHGYHMHNKNSSNNMRGNHYEKSPNRRNHSYSHRKRSVSPSRENYRQLQEERLKRGVSVEELIRALSTQDICPSS